MTFTLVGHRGAGHLAPENTLASFARAAALGVGELELDLRLSADGHIVVIHDATVDRTTDGSGEVVRMGLAELRRLDAGQGQRIPTLTEVLEATELPLQVEIKDAAVLDPLVDVLGAAGAERSRITLTTFDGVLAAQLRSLFPDLPVGLILPEPTDELLELALRIGVSGVFGRIEQTTPGFVAAAQGAGLRVDLWPVNSVEDVRRAAELGVDGFTTDDPQVLAEAGYAIREGRLSPV